MATTITGNQQESGGLTATVALHATAGNCTAITLPAWARSVSIQFRDSGGADTTGQISRGAAETDGVAISSSAYPTQTSAHVEFRARPGRSSGAVTIYVACGANSGKAHLMIEG